MPNENGQYVVWAVWNDGSRGVHHFANLAAAQAKWDAYEAVPLNTWVKDLPGWMGGMIRRNFSDTGVIDHFLEVLV